jgi:RND family efflux transporter MFP subunit
MTFFKRIFNVKWFLIILVVAVTGLVVYKTASSTSNKKIESTTVKHGDLAEKLTISGEIDADEKVTLRFPSSGRISWVGVKVGDRLNKYQMVATQDSREVEKNLKKYLETYMSSRWDLEQTRDNYKNQIVSDSIKRVLEKAQSSLDSTVLDVEIKNLAVEYSRLWTPIEGIVTKVDSPYAGVYATSTQAEFEVVNPSTVKFVAKADQVEVPRLTNIMSGTLVLDAFPDQEIKGNITNIGFTPVSGETGTVYPVDFSLNLDNSDYRYKLGMTGDLTFVTNQKTGVLYLPNRFIKGGSDPYVWIMKNDKKARQKIKTGLETNEGTEIISGITQGERVYDN